MKACVLLTARAGSKSVPNKNTMLFDGYPLFYHNVVTAHHVSEIESVYVSTDCGVIKEYANSAEYAYTVIDRPLELSTDTASHHDVMVHGLEWMEQRGKAYDAIIIMLGNANGATAHDLSQAINMLELNQEASSVLSVSEFNMFNPFRAYKISDNMLDTVVPQSTIQEISVEKNLNDRKSAGTCYFFNGAFMAVRPHVIKARDGKLPFIWLGHNILPYVMPVSMEIDAPWQIEHIKSHIKKDA